jgi:hypothetical protein
MRRSAFARALHASLTTQTEAASEGALALSRLKIDRAVKAGYLEAHSGR